jgi:hypothetical protein
MGKDNVLFFAGDIRPEDITYSHGVRQTLFAMFNNTPGTAYGHACLVSERGLIN